MTTIRHTLAPLLAASLLALGLPARAGWFGHVELRSDQVERGETQSDHAPGASASIGWAHAAGARVSLGIATVSDTQFAGSDGYRLMPEIGWDGPLGADWQAGAWLRGQIFPGAQGGWYGQLPPRVQARVAEPASGDYGTAELGLSLGWRWLTLSWARSLTDYLGISAVESEGVGAARRQVLLESTGTQYLALDLAWPATEQLTLTAGVGRLRVPNFESLDYTDWRVGLVLKAAGLDWGLQASGTDASSDAYRPRARSDGRSTTATTVAASVGWHF